MFYKRTITRFSADKGCLSASETGDAIGFRQHLSTTSFEAFELEITMNYPVHMCTLYNATLIYMSMMQATRSLVAWVNCWRISRPYNM